MLTDEDRARILPLEGAGNFRDFGGYPAGEGLRVKRGLLFRSNRLSRLTAGDIATLEATGITTIFDLRASREREADPTAWQSLKLSVHTWPPGHKRRLVDMAQEYPPDAEGARALMQDFYAQMPRVMSHAFADIIRRIAAGAAPCVIHCSAGKDRTGVAVALVLTTLGVPREIVLDDYAMTDRIAASEDDVARSLFVGRDGGERAHDAMRARFSPEAIAMMRSARPGQLDAALAAIDRNYGSFDAFLASIGVDRDVAAMLRARLLEPV
ncbi:tyrosine-protein phosphatase [Aurantiacibacter zhengii]|nr:tyrosine-protein phosphatase [Aurantiacibacter zhengii]